MKETTLFAFQVIALAPGVTRAQSQATQPPPGKNNVITKSMWVALENI